MQTGPVAVRASGLERGEHRVGPDRPAPTQPLQEDQPHTQQVPARAIRELFVHQGLMVLFSLTLSVIGEDLRILMIVFARSYNVNVLDSPRKK